MFDSAILKIKRADHHIGDLETQFAALVNNNACTLWPQQNSEAGTYHIRARFERNIVGKRLALIIGDAIHNLRTALDHVTWEVVGSSGGNQHRQLYFPVGDCQVNFEATCKGRIEAPNKATICGLLKSMEAFPSGKGDSLYTIHALDRMDKHTSLLPVCRDLEIPEYTVLNPVGSVFLQQPAGLMASGDTGSIPVQSDIPAGASIQVKQDTKPRIGIFFGNIEVVPSQPVFETLRKLRHAASNAIDIVERAIT